MAAEEADKRQESEAEEQQPKDKSKSGGLIKFVIFGVVGVVAIVGIAFGTLMLIGTDKPVTEESADLSKDPTDQSSDTASSDHTTSGDHHEPMSEEDSILALLEEEDQSVIENIMSNLEMLDYEPTDSEMAGPDGMTTED